jgi:hypothetical protein
VYSTDESVSMIDRSNFQFPYLEKMLDLLRPWFTSKIDLDSTGQIDNLDKDQINIVLNLLSITEYNIAIKLIFRNEFILAEIYCQEALPHARLYDGTDKIKTDLVFDALLAYYGHRTFQGNYVDALPFAEVASNLFAIAYYPVHPKVQQAARMLIQCLIHKGDFCE